MKRIKCTLMVMLALGFLMCLGQDAMAQEAKTAVEARANFKVKTAAFKANPHKSMDKAKLEKGKAAHAKKKQNSAVKKQANTGTSEILRDKNTHQPKAEKKAITGDREAVKKKQQVRMAEMKAKMAQRKDTNRKQVAKLKAATLRDKVKSNQN